MSHEVVDLRRSERFIVLEPLAGTFSTFDVTITNIGLTGLQMVHAQPLRIGTRAPLAFKRGDIAVETQARVVWSHLSPSTTESGRLLYNSGIRLETTDPHFALALNSLLRDGILRHDSESLQRKREQIAQREQQRKAALRIMPK